jgi:DNA-binding CsgD family transcriptional regulator
MCAGRREVPLLGRDGELAALRVAAARAADGLPAVVVLRAESGLGKTRLGRELLAGLDATGWVTSSGTAVPIAGPRLPYGPWKQAVRGLGSSLPAGSDTEAQVAEHVLGVLDERQAGGPVAVMLDDLQWADASSVTLLASVAYGLLAPQRVLLVIAMRVEREPEEDQRLRDLVAELLRREDVTDCRLGPLPDDVVRSLMGAVAGEGVADPLVRRAGGNPFAAIQLAEAAGAGDPEAALPDALREVLSARLRRSGPEVARTVAAVALAAAPVRGALLEAVLGTAAPVAAAVDAGLLAVDPAGRIVVPHPLLQQAATELLPPTERDELHRRFADAIGAGDADSDPVTALALVAHHRLAAGELDAAVLACRDAAAAASAAGAHDDAYRLLEQALRRAGRYGGSLGEPVRRAIRAGCAAEAYAAGRAGDAVTLWRACLEAATETDEAVGLRLHLARALRSAGRPAEAMAEIAQAWAARDHLTGRRRAEVHAARAAMAMVQGGYREAAGIAEAGLGDADLDAEVESELRNTLGTSLALLGEAETGLVQLRLARELARRAGAVEALCRAHNNLAFVLQVLGRTGEAADESLRGLAAARAGGMERSAGGLMLCNAVESLVASARWERAANLVEYALERPFPAEVLAAVHQSAAQVAIARGDAELAARHLAEAAARADAVGAPQFHAQLAETEAGLALLRADPAGALAAVRRGLAAVAGTDDDSVVPALVAVGLRAAGDAQLRLRVAGAVVDPGAADELWAWLEPLLGEPAKARAEPVDGLRAAELRLCRLERARLWQVDEPGEWSAHAEQWHAVDRPQHAAYAQLRAAEAALRQRSGGGRDLAAAALDAADRALEPIGPCALAAEVAALRRRARLTAAAAAQRPDGAQPAVVLTTREREVLALLGEGHTNRRISRQLFISEKTASVHVSNILGKLHASNRGEAVAVAQRLGLLARTPVPA